MFYPLYHLSIYFFQEKVNNFLLTTLKKLATLLKSRDLLIKSYLFIYFALHFNCLYSSFDYIKEFTLFKIIERVNVLEDKNVHFIKIFMTSHPNPSLLSCNLVVFHHLLTSALLSFLGNTSKSVFPLFCFFVPQVNEISIYHSVSDLISLTWSHTIIFMLQQDSLSHH